MLDAGTVSATLRGDFNPKGFRDFDAAMLGAGRRMRAFEDASVRSSSRISAATAAMGRATKVAAVGGVAAFGYAIVKSAQASADFEAAMRNVNSIAGLSERRLQALGDRVKDLAISSGKMPTDLAAGLYDIVSTGFRADDAIKILAVSTKAAAAGLTDTATATDVMTSALSAYGLGAGHARHVSDILFQAVNVGKLSFEQLAGSIGTVLPSAAALDIPLRDVAAAMAAITLNGTSADEAATQLSGVMTQLTKPSEALRTQLRSMGYESGQAAINALGFKGVLDKLGAAAHGNQQTLQEWFSDIRAVRGVQGLVGTDHAARVFTSSIRSMDAAIKGAGQTQRTYNEQQRSFNHQLDRAKAAVNVLAITAGAGLLPVLTDFAKGFTRWVDDLDPADIKQFGEGVADALEEIVDLGQEVFDVGSDVVGVLTSIGNALGMSDVETFAAIGGAILAWKTVGSVAAGVGALASAVVRLGGASRALAAGQGAAGVLGALAGTGAAGGAGAAGVGAGAAAGTLGRLALGLARVAGPLAATVGAAKLASDAIENLVTGGKGFDSQIEGPVEATQLSLDDLKDGAVGVVNALDFVKDGFSDAGDQARNFQQWMDKATEISDGAHTSFLHVRDGVEQTGRAFAQSRLSLAQARAALDATTEGTDAHRQALLDYRTALAENMQQERAWNDGKAAARSLARSQVEATRLQIDRLRELRAEQGLTTDQEYELEGLYQQLEGRLNTQAALTANLARMHRGMAKATGEAEQALGRLARAGEGGLARRIALTYELPKDAGRVAAQAVRAVQAGVKPTVITRVVAQTANARAAVQAMRAMIAGVPPSKVFRVIGETRDARTQVAALRALVAGVPPSKVLRILEQGGPNVLAKLRQLAATALPPKTQRVVGDDSPVRSMFAVLADTVLPAIVQPIVSVFSGGPSRKRAAGKAAGSGEAAIVGEGSRWQGAREAIVDRRTGTGFIVDRPTAVNLSDDHYVIPLDEYRGRALGLFLDLARDLGVERYSRGRGPRRRASGGRRRGAGGRDGDRHDRRRVPAKIAEGGVPFEDVKQRYEQAADALRRARDAERATKKALKEAQDDLKAARSKEQRASAQREVDRLTKQLTTNRRTIAERKPVAERRRRYLARARETDNKIKNLQTDINVARDAMDDADRIDDQAAFDKAKRTRTAKLRSLIGLLQRAFSLAGRDDPNSDHYRSLKELLSQLGGQAAVDQRRDGFGGELGQAEAQEMDVEEPEPVEPEAMTEDEKKRLSRINADIALAALTTPLDDDTRAAQGLVDFLTGVLGEVQADPAGRGGDEAIADIAGQLKTARDNLTALTTGSGTNDNADLQAQLEQERQRRETAETNARISDAAVAALTGSGDIGAGGSNAMGAAAQPQIVIQTLHPADPATLTAIGEAAAGGFSYQSYRPAKRARVGA